MQVMLPEEKYMSISARTLKSDSITATSIWSDVVHIKEQVPLIHNITNYVVMEFTANVLLALGASPVMAHAIEEVEEMCSIANSLVINIGTLSSSWIEGMHKAFEIAKKRKIPIVFDPVGAGSTSYRTAVARDFINLYPTVIRGNASEISSVSTSMSKSSTKGVESTLSPESVLKDAQALSQEIKRVVVISGETDYIIEGKKIILVRNGHSMMPKVVGMGCSATAIIGAFLSVNPSAFLASAHAMIFIGIAGEIAAKKAQALGSFKTAFIDAIYTMSESDLKSHLNIEIL